MAAENNLPNEGQNKVDLATQVANVAAQVCVAVRSGDQGRCVELEAKLALARERLAERGAPPGLIPFIDVVRGLLQGQDVSGRVHDLPMSYRAVCEQIVDDLGTEKQEEELTVRKVMDEISQNVILAMKRGTFDHRRRMADTLLTMEVESRKRPDLTALIDFLAAARILLKGGDPSPIEAQLIGPFRERWDQILDALRE